MRSPGDDRQSLYNVHVAAAGSESPVETSTSTSTAGPASPRAASEAAEQAPPIVLSSSRAIQLPLLPIADPRECPSHLDTPLRHRGRHSQHTLTLSRSRDRSARRQATSHVYLQPPTAVTALTGLPDRPLDVARCPTSVTGPFILLPSLLAVACLLAAAAALSLSRPLVARTSSSFGVRLRQ